MITLGIDSGTQSTKTIALDVESGEILATAQQAYGLLEGLPPGHMEQDPATWIEATEATLRSCLGKLGTRRDEVAGIGVSGQQHGLVAMDADGNPVRPAKLWCDTSTAEQCAKFDAEFGGPEGLIALAGNAMLPGYTAPKLLWLKDNEPENYRKVRHVQLPHDYLNYWLSGQLRMEYGDASGTGVMDVRQRVWCAPLLRFIGGEAESFFPELRSSSQPCGELRAPLQKAWGLARSPCVSAGGGDNMMGAIGTGNIAPGTVTASLGTSGTLYAYSAQPAVDPGGEVAAFCDSTGGWLPLVCTMNVTVATEKVRALFGWDHAALESAVAATAPGAEGVLFLPYLNGERTPNLPDGRGGFHGLTMQNLRPGPLARAAMEGVTLGLAYGLERFRELGVAPSEIRLTGGGSNSPAWRQIAADVFGVPVVCLAVGEGAALGAALQAAWTCGQGEESDALAALTSRIVVTDESTRVQPDAARVKLYAGLRERQTDLTRHLHQTGYL